MKWNYNRIQKLKRPKVIQIKRMGNKTDGFNLFQVFDKRTCELP